MSWLISGVSRSPTLFQIAGAPSAAYSLRQLDPTVNAVVRVRRSSDNAEQDFTATQVTDGTLTTFCGAGDGFVRTWYDQSGNGQNATQATSGNQPRIVISGQLVIEQGKPAIDFNGSTSRLPTALAEPASYTVFCIARARTAAGAGRVFGYQAFRSVGTFGSGSTWGFFSNSSAAVMSLTGFPWNTRTLIYLQLNVGASSTLAGNAGSGVIFTPSTQSTSVFGIGFNGSSGDTCDGLIQELIFYSSSQSSSRSNITANINAHYAIY